MDNKKWWNNERLGYQFLFVISIPALIFFAYQVYVGLTEGRVMTQFGDWIQIQEKPVVFILVFGFYLLLLSSVFALKTLYKIAFGRMKGKN
jgi:fumarate reductase subunit C